MVSDSSEWALNSAVECHPHTVEVIGSNPIAPTTSEVFRWTSNFHGSELLLVLPATAALAL